MTVAQHFIQVGTIKVGGVMLEVNPVQRTKIFESEQHSMSMSEASVPLSPVVEVSWSHDDLNKQILMMYLNNKKRSCGGPVKDMQFFEEERKAHVRFVDAECKLLQCVFVSFSCVDSLLLQKYFYSAVRNFSDVMLYKIFSCLLNKTWF